MQRRIIHALLLLALAPATANARYLHMETAKKATAAWTGKGAAVGHCDRMSPRLVVCNVTERDTWQGWTVTRPVVALARRHDVLAFSPGWAGRLIYDG